MFVLVGSSSFGGYIRFRWMRMVVFLVIMVLLVRISVGIWFSGFICSRVLCFGFGF